MAEQKKMVEEITSMDVDFAKWYTDVVKKAELVEYTSVKGGSNPGLPHYRWILYCLSNQRSPN